MQFIIGVVLFVVVVGAVDARIPWSRRDSGSAAR